MRVSFDKSLDSGICRLNEANFRAHLFNYYSFSLHSLPNVLYDNQEADGLKPAASDCASLDRHTEHWERNEGYKYNSLEKVCSEFCLIVSADPRTKSFLEAHPNPTSVFVRGQYDSLQYFGDYSIL